MKYIQNHLRKIMKPIKVRYNHFDEIWSIDLADMVNYKISNNKRFRYMFVIKDN